MKVKRLRLLPVLLLTLLVTGCASQMVNPLAQNQTTAVPGLNMALHAATADETNADTMVANLYFRYQSEPMLAAEERELSVSKNQTPEMTIIQALIDGPSAGRSELRQVIPTDTTVESVNAKDGILYVMLNERFLQDDVPTDWATHTSWRTEAPLLRKLTIQSIVCSITEYYPYRAIQFMILNRSDLTADFRLNLSYFLDGRAGPSDPMTRDETMLLTAQNTATILFTAWQRHDYERMYTYIVNADKPSLANMSAELEQIVTLKDFTLTAGSLTQSGQQMTMMASLQTVRANEGAAATTVPIQMKRENGIWKMSYAHLRALMLP